MVINPEEVEKVFTLPVSYFEENIPKEYMVKVEAQPEYIDQETKEKVILLPAKELGLPEQYHKSWGGFKQKIYAYITSEGVIWGITARIIRDFIGRF